MKNQSDNLVQGRYSLDATELWNELGNILCREEKLVEGKREWVMGGGMKKGERAREWQVKCGDDSVERSAWDTVLSLSLSLSLSLHLNSSLVHVSVANLEKEWGMWANLRKEWWKERRGMYEGRKERTVLPNYYRPLITHFLRVEAFISSTFISPSLSSLVSFHSMILFLHFISKIFISIFARQNIPPRPQLLRLSNNFLSSHNFI